MSAADDTTTPPPLDAECMATWSELSGDLSTALANLDDATLPAVRDMRAPAPPENLSPRVGHEDHDLPNGNARVRVYRRSDGSAPTAERPVAALVWIHGGGYVMGTYDTPDPLMYEWVDALGIVCVSVDYRLAPEHPYPAAIDDCYAAVSWLHERANDFGVDRSRIIVGGDSAGGGLAAAVALRTRDDAGPELAGQLLVYPMIDDRQQTASSQWPEPVWPPSANHYGWSSYLGADKGGPNVSPHAAPARAEDLSGLPPTLIVVGSAEGFSDEDTDYATRLRHHGVEVEFHIYPGAPHAFFSLLPMTRLGQKCRRDVSEWLDHHANGR